METNLHTHLGNNLYAHLRAKTAHTYQVWALAREGGVGQAHPRHQIEGHQKWWWEGCSGRPQGVLEYSHPHPAHST